MELELNTEKLISGKIGIDKITNFDVSDLPCKIAGQIPLKENDNEAGLNFNDWQILKNEKLTDLLLMV